MLNDKQQRELCYVTTVGKIEPIPGRDHVECAHVGGWTVMVRKGQFREGDPGIYFEVDSKCPDQEPFQFLEKCKYKIKTQKYSLKDSKGNKIGQFWSQGLLMSADDFGWIIGSAQFAGGTDFIVDDKGVQHFADDSKTMFLTEQLGVTYADPEDNVRKGKGSAGDKYKKMAQRHPKVFRNRFVRWLYKYNWGKKLLFVFFGKKREKNTAFPTHFPYVKKTDQERCENMPWVLQDKTPFIVTQKCDGSSGTYILERKKHGKFEFYVCSRNVRQLDEKQKCFYDENHYWNVAKKYDVENKLKEFLINHPKLEYVCWQGEVCSPSIQGNPQGLTEDHLFLFHFIDSERGKWDMREAVKYWKEHDLETVPIVDENFILPDDFEEFKQQADGFYDPSVCEGKDKQPREGFVYYKTTEPNFSFKNVSRPYLLKHNN